VTAIVAAARTGAYGLIRAASGPRRASTRRLLNAENAEHAEKRDPVTKRRRGA